MEPKYLTVRELFNKEDRYIIPIYQRNYAWEESQIAQLIQDIYDVYKDNKNYYLGSLIVYKREDKYETIDGQQRLTTLNILACVLKHNTKDIHFFNDANVNLEFDSRIKSNRTLEYFNKNGNTSTTLKLHPQMKQAFVIIERKLQELFKRDLSKFEEFKSFLDFFLDNVKILRIQVPEGTDLNHYFEVMNNRGEQLEKHEVLKAKFLDTLSKSDHSEKYRKTFNLVWEACSYMDRYVQYVFKKEYRVPLFGNYWNKIQFDDFQAISDKTFQTEEFLETEGEELKNTFKNIVLGKIIIKENTEKEVNEEGIERFTPVTSFPHFLLQVLRITVDSNVQLDDKKLISQFKEHLLDKENSLELTKEFGYNLLKNKFLFDNYILKRDSKNDKESWAILALKKQDNYEIGTYVNTFGDNNTDQNKLVYLQSMYHVSFPQTNYKHWLSACLKFLSNNINIKVEDYIYYLETLSDEFYFNRLAGELNYHKIIFENQGCISTGSPTDIDAYLNIGTSVNNFIFNRLDYLLYYNIENQIEQIPKQKRDNNYVNFNRNNFEFSFRSSVEHYAPQQPKNNDKPIANIDNFGNLCLISAKRNSELSNYSPTAKKEHYRKSDGIESLKQRLMMCYKTWDENSVDEHQVNMVALLNTKALDKLELTKKNTATKIEFQCSFWESLKKKLENNNLELIKNKSVTKENVAKYYLENQNGNILNGFWSKIEIENPKILNNNITIHFGIEIDHKVYFGFTLEENGTVGISNNQKFNEYIELVKSINKNYTNNKDWLGWRYTQEDLNFKNPSQEIISNLADPEKLDQTTNKIVADILNDINALKTKLENI